MCGIGGILNFSGQQIITKEHINILSSSLAKRGPDFSGKWVSDCNKINFVHRRLTIIDTSKKSNQPMLSDDLKIIIVFNGEIYNYLELKKNLEKKYKFYSSGDTEVIINLYKEYGLDFAKKLRGMFSIAIWDEKKKNLILTRDRNGIKPLYYSNNGKLIIFASQVKAILKTGIINDEPDPAGWCSFFLWGNLSENYTTNKKIKSLSPGEIIVYNYYGKIIHQDKNSILNLHRNILNNKADSDNTQETLRSLIEKSILKHTISDVPIGVLLSGGIDSAIICNVLNRYNLSKNVTAITMGFEEFENTKMDEIRFAKKISESNNMEHIFFKLKKKDFFDDLNSFINDMDQPTIDGLNTWFISKFVKKNNLKVVLSGVGADEIFSGYPTFNFIPRMYKLMRFFPKIFLDQCKILFSKSDYFNFYSPKLISLFQYNPTIENLYFIKRGLFMPWELNDILDENFLKEGLSELNIFDNIRKTFDEINNTNSKISALETVWYLQNRLLRDIDWAGMSHSLEIRTPYVDKELLSSLIPLLNKEEKIYKKSILINSFAEFLPKEILSRKKVGFEMPLSIWLKESFEKKKKSKIGRSWSLQVSTRFLDSIKSNGGFLK